MSWSWQWHVEYDKGVHTLKSSCIESSIIHHHPSITIIIHFPSSSINIHPMETTPFLSSSYLRLPDNNSRLFGNQFHVAPVKKVYLFISGHGSCGCFWCFCFLQLHLCGPIVGFVKEIPLWIWVYCWWFRTPANHWETTSLNSLHPWKLHGNWKLWAFQVRTLLFLGSIFRFYVGFLGSSQISSIKSMFDQCFNFHANWIISLRLCWGHHWHPLDPLITKQLHLWYS